MPVYKNRWQNLQNRRAAISQASRPSSSGASGVPTQTSTCSSKSKPSSSAKSKPNNPDVDEDITTTIILQEEDLSPFPSPAVIKKKMVASNPPPSNDDGDQDHEEEALLPMQIMDKVEEQKSAICRSSSSSTSSSSSSSSSKDKNCPSVQPKQNVEEVEVAPQPSTSRVMSGKSKKSKLGITPTNNNSNSTVVEGGKPLCSVDSPGTLSPVAFVPPPVKMFKNFVRKRPIYNENDPIWIKFLTDAKTFPTTAHDLLLSDLIDADADGPKILNTILYHSLKKPAKERDILCKIVVKSIMSATIQHDNGKQCVIDLVNTIFVELRQFSTETLHHVVESCLAYLKNDEDDKDETIPPKWIELFGQTMEVLMERDDIKHSNDVMIKGREYKEIVIAEILQLKWTVGSCISLISLFTCLPKLEVTNFKTLLQHVHQCVKSFPPPTFPKVISKLICVSSGSSKLILDLIGICSDYFKDIQFSDKTSLVERQKRNALGSVVCSFLETSIYSSTLLKTALDIIQGSNYEFDVLKNPFVMSIILGLTKFTHCHDMIIEKLRNSIVRAFYSCTLVKESRWYGGNTLKDGNVVTQAFRFLAKSKLVEVEFMIGGIKGLGFSLLNSDRLQSKYPNTLEMCEQLGTFLITTVVRISQEELCLVMRQLLKANSTHSTIECLACCFEKHTRQIISPSVINTTAEIIQHLEMLDPYSSQLLTNALSGAIQLNISLRDTLMNMLRKGARKSMDAKIARVQIMGILLANAKTVGDIPFSQYSRTQRNDFYDDESESSKLPDTEPMCLEILKLLQQSLFQETHVRVKIYKTYPTIVKKNPSLCEMVCNQILNHCKQYFSELEDDKMEIDFNGLIGVKAKNDYTNVIIKEEFGFLMQCIGFIIVESFLVFSSVEDGPPVVVTQLETIFRRALAALLSTSIHDVERTTALMVAQDPIENYLAAYLDSALIVQLLQAIEGFIEFLIYQNDKKDQNTLEQLIYKYLAWKECFTEKDKICKRKPRISKGKTKTSVSNARTSRTNNDDDDGDDGDNDDVSDAAPVASKSSTSVSKKTVDRLKKLSVTHIISLTSIQEIFEKAFQQSAEDALNLSCIDLEFEQQLFGIVLTKLEQFVNKEQIIEDDYSNYPTVLSAIAGTIWVSLINAKATNESPNIPNVLQKLKTINSILSKLCTFQAAIPTTDLIMKLFAYGNKDTEAFSSYNQSFSQLFSVWKGVQEWIPLTDENQSSEIHQVLLEILHSFSVPLTPEPGFDDSAGVITTTEVSNWLWNFMSSRKPIQPGFQLAESLCNCWLAYMAKDKSFLIQPETDQGQHDVLSLAKAIRQELGSIQRVHEQNDDDEGREEHNDNSNAHVRLWIVNNDTAATLLCCVMNQVDVRLAHVADLLEKLRFSSLNDGSFKGKMARIRASCFDLLHQVIRICVEFANSAIPLELPCKTLLMVFPKIFDILSGFAGYFMELLKSNITFSIKGFAVPVNLISTGFHGAVEMMVEHIEKNDREDVKQRIVDEKKRIKKQLSSGKKLIPNLIYSIEMFNKQILLLSQLLKNKGRKGGSLRVNMKFSNLRDFKIDSRKVDATLEDIDPENPAQTSSDVTGNESSLAKVDPNTRSKRKRKKHVDTN